MNSQRSRKRQYIGATGFKWRSEVDGALASLPESFEGRLMVGVLANADTINGLPSKQRPNRYPHRDKIKPIFSGSPRTLNLVHFSSPHRDRLLEELTMIELICGPGLDGVQLNMVWPDPDQIKIWRDQRQQQQNTYVVLQCGARAIAQVEGSPIALADKIALYGDAIEYVLIDASGGLGRPLEPNFIIDCLGELYARNFPNLSCVVAGGLSSQTLQPLLEPVMRIFHDVSFDVEKGVLDPDDNIEPVELDNYLVRGAEMVEKYKSAAA